MARRFNSPRKLKVELEIDERTAKAAGEKIAEATRAAIGASGGPAAATAGVGAFGEAGRAAGSSRGGFGRSFLGATTIQASIASAADALRDPYASRSELGARTLSTTAGATAGAVVERATGSEIAGAAAAQLTQAGIDRMTQPGLNVMQRARESTFSRLEDLAAAGFNVSNEEINRVSEYELKKERNREKFRERAAGQFARTAENIGIGAFGLGDGGDVNNAVNRAEAALTGFLQRLEDKLGKRGVAVPHGQLEG